MLTHRYQQRLCQRKEQGNWRTLPSHQAPVDLTSHDYLGFSRNPAFFSCNRTGSTGSRLLTGNSTLAESLETQIAAFHGAPAGLIFNSGYTANLGIASTLPSAEDVCLYDAHIHASTYAGLRLSRATLLPFRHNHLEHLEKRLRAATPKTVFVFIETVYSCDGSLAPLKEICRLCGQYRAQLIVDEAHATGVVGPQGKGLVADQGCEERVFARMHTFSKALGAFGAIVLGSSLLKKYLINYCHPFIYATALPVPVLLAVQAAYNKLPNAREAQKHLFNLIEHFKQIAAKAQLPLFPSYTPIQPLLIPGNENARALAFRLGQAGYQVHPLLSPTIQRGTERLRICLHSFNTFQEVETFTLLIQEFLCEKSLSFPSAPMREKLLSVQPS